MGYYFNVYWQGVTCLYLHILMITIFFLSVTDVLAHYLDCHNNTADVHLIKVMFLHGSNMELTFLNNNVWVRVFVILKISCTLISWIAGGEKILKSFIGISNYILPWTDKEKMINNNNVPKSWMVFRHLVGVKINKLIN